MAHLQILREEWKFGSHTAIKSKAKLADALGFGPADIARTPAMGLIARLLGLFGVTVALVALVAARYRHRLVAQVVGLGALAWSAVVVAHLELFQACPGGDEVVQQAVLPWVALGCVNGLGLLGVGLGRKARAKAKRA